MKESLFISLIFLGDTHGFIDDFRKQKQVIKKYKPEYVLSEQLQDIILDSPIAFKNFKEKKLKFFSELKKLVDLCEKENISLVGIDFKDFGLSYRLKRIVDKKLNISIRDNKEFEKIMAKREVLHVKKINDYKIKTKKPLIVILGAWHLREDSLIRKYFDSFKIIYPSDNSGKLVMRPTKKDICYNEYIKTKR